MLTNISLGKLAKPSLCLFAGIVGAIFSLASCAERGSYGRAYDECRALPGRDTIKFQLCPRLAELKEREQKLKEKLERIKKEQENIVLAISSSNQGLQ